MENIVNVISSNIFANLCQLFSDIGTVGAVIVSLIVIFKQNRINAKITSATEDMIPFNSDRKNIYVSGYSVTIFNLSNNQNIHLKQGLYLKTNKPDESGNNLLLFIILPEIMKTFPFKDVLGPDKEYTFFLSEKKIKTVLDRTNSNKIRFYFVDKFNKKYNALVKKDDLEKRLSYIDKNGDKIISL